MDEGILKEASGMTETTVGPQDGQIKCPKCGATDISTDTRTGQLRCNFCRHQFVPDFAKADADITTLEGTTTAGGAGDIQADSEDVMTLKCQSCGAEVVIDTKASTQARCHWCRNTLSINSQIPNGAVPDVVLPFKVTRKEAEAEIGNFVKARKFFAHPTFTREFTTENICGVYFPYMIVDVNGHMQLSGEGEIQTGVHRIKKGDKEREVYDADRYRVSRAFDISIDDLSIEASSDKLDYSSREKTTNIINAIMPFDTENCLQYNANYLRGYTSERRDANVSNLKQLTDKQSADIARLAAKDSIQQYDRGVRWDEENFVVKGDSWKSAYLPVWLYSYMQKKGDHNLMHYVAVNARTKETMGSVPINRTKLILTSIAVELFGGVLAYLIEHILDVDTNYTWLLYLSGFVFYLVMYLRYRNANARHSYELETKREVLNLQQEDVYLRHLVNLENSMIEGENSSEVRGERAGFELDQVLGSALEKGVNLDEVVNYTKKLNRMDKH